MSTMNLTKEIRHVFPLPFEKHFNAKIHFEYAKHYYTAASFCTILYLVLLYFGMFYMRNRPAYNLRKTMILWNSALALMSLWGTVRVLPELHHSLKHYGFRNSICMYVSPDDVEPVSAFWYYVFAMSKFLELGDSVFLVLRKKKLIFLHWFHHSSVLFFTFYMAIERATICRWFGNMNYAVHAVMYGYFALRAAEIKVPRKFAIFITTAQIAQMIAGFCLTICALFFKMYSADTCPGMSNNAVKVSMVAYSFYFLLFLNFFYKSYYKYKPAAVHAKDE